MPLSLDHVVIAVADLDKAFADYGRLGFTVIRGGEHANGITHNVLVVLEDGAYLELIAWKKPDPGNRWSDVFAEAGEGFVDYALLPDDIAAVVAGAQERGLDIEDPQPGGRARPDGERLDWQTARSRRADVPFLCGDVTPRALRVQEGDVRRHANGITGIRGITVAVENLESALERNAALLSVEPPTEVGTEVVGGTPARVATLDLGGTTLTLASPTALEGKLATNLSSRGEGPFALVFRGPEDHPLDHALSHGAHLFMTRR